MLRLLDLKNTHLLPQRGKRCSVSGFTLLSILERNPARSAFKRFFSSRSLRRVQTLITQGQSLRVFDAPNLIYSTSCYHGIRAASHQHYHSSGCFRTGFQPDFLYPVSNQSNEVGHRPKRTEVTAPRPFEKQSSDQHDSQQCEIKAGADKMKECAKNLVAGNARIPVEESEHDRG